MPRGKQQRRRTVLLPDEVVPACLTDPSGQAARNRRWARKTAAGSMALLTIIGAALIEIFQPSRAKVTAEQQHQGVADRAMRVGEPEDGGGRFSGSVRL